MAEPATRSPAGDQEAPIDADSFAAPFDAAPFDAAPFDAAPFDAAPFDAAPFDPVAVDRAYLQERARRHARLERSRARRRAGLRFWFVLLGLIAVSVVLTLTVWREVERLFGL